MTDDREDSLEQRMKRLSADLAERRDAGTSGQDQSRSTLSGYRLAVKLSSEFVAGVAVGAVLGLLFDWFAGTKPWGLVVLLLLGFAAGVLNVLRSAGVVTSPHPADRYEELNRKRRDGKS